MEEILKVWHFNCSSAPTSLGFPEFTNKKVEGMGAVDRQRHLGANNRWNVGRTKNVKVRGVSDLDKRGHLPIYPTTSAALW